MKIPKDDIKFKQPVKLLAEGEFRREDDPYYDRYYIGEELLSDPFFNELYRKLKGKEVKLYIEVSE